MALTTLAQLADALETAHHRRIEYGYTSGGTANTLNGGWTISKNPPYPAAVPTVPPTTPGAACDRSTNGAIAVPGATPAAGKKLYLVRITGSQATSRARVPWIIDRLVHVSGLSGIVTTAQAVNSAALPARATGGKNVEAALEWYVGTGATATTATVIYVDDSGTTRTVTMPVPASSGAGQMELIPFPPQVQTRGIRSITSVQLAASTLTAGNFGVVLFRRIAAFQYPVGAPGETPQDWPQIGLRQVDREACLQVVHPIDAAGNMAVGGEMFFAEA
jgi:hypothetical protein